MKAKRGNSDFDSIKPRTIPGLNEGIEGDLDCAEVSTPLRFEIELPKGSSCCCMFDGSIVQTVYLSPTPPRNRRQPAPLKTLSAKSGA
jgi:hypothetical protein